MRDPFAVGRRKRFPSQHRTIGCQTFSLTDAVCRNLPEFHFAALSRERYQRFAVREHDCVSKSRSFLSSGFDQPSLLGGSEKYFAAREENDVPSVPGDSRTRSVLRWLLHPAFTQ